MQLNKTYLETTLGTSACHDRKYLETIQGTKGRLKSVPH